MAWTETTRRNCVRRTSRYASDLTDREREFIAPFMPLPRRVGRPRGYSLSYRSHREDVESNEKHALHLST
jgi:hypothetical protein